MKKSKQLLMDDGNCRQRRFVFFLFSCVLFCFEIKIDCTGLNRTERNEARPMEWSQMENTIWFVVVDVVVSNSPDRESLLSDKKRASVERRMRMRTEKLLLIFLVLSKIFPRARFSLSLSASTLVKEIGHNIWNSKSTARQRFLSSIFIKPLAAQSK